jgi:NADH:ubiquinone oxidoreductase subunit 4 (subunit M)
VPVRPTNRWLSVVAVVLGVYPQPILDAVQPKVDRIAHIANPARQRAGVEPIHPMLW